MIDHFINCILNGEPPCNSAFLGAMVVATLEAAFQSAKAEGKPVYTGL